MPATVVDAPKTIVSRPRFVKSRSIEKVRPHHGEKPFERLVDEAFDGPVMRLSQRLRLLEEAGNRRICKGDALDLIASKQRELEKKHAIRKPSPRRIFATHFAAFAASYVLLALGWCLVMG
jgi:hypothetical protein